MAEHLIHIVGNSFLQNELLITYLAKETGFQITNSASIKDVSLAESGNDDSKMLLIFDCLGVPGAQIWDQPGLQEVVGSSQVMLALLNVELGLGLEKEAIRRGVRGLFFVNEKPEMLAKGIDHIIDGELWYSRKIISQCLLEQGKAFKNPLQHSVKLSSREKEILVEITSGASNQDIAETLFVSQYTVKTHVYNIYKKINVTSRLQAMLWAAKHL